MIDLITALLTFPTIWAIMAFTGRRVFKITAHTGMMGAGLLIIGTSAILAAITSTILYVNL